MMSGKLQKSHNINSKPQPVLCLNGKNRWRFMNALRYLKACLVESSLVALDRIGCKNGRAYNNARYQNAREFSSLGQFQGRLFSLELRQDKKRYNFLKSKQLALCHCLNGTKLVFQFKSRPPTSLEKIPGPP